MVVDNFNTSGLTDKWGGRAAAAGCFVSVARQFVSAASVTMTARYRCEIRQLLHCLPPQPVRRTRDDAAM